MNVTLNREAIKSAIRARLAARMAAAAHAVQHTNHDARFSPSEWYESWAADAPRNRGVTSGELTVDGLTVKLHLEYGYERINS